ncbi:MAG: MFS transporter, partial [Candidatus Dormibacteraeota bacterium]|nr:MFS transporter [Candidatus Dormibacteraeota bacterium]
MVRRALRSIAIDTWALRQSRPFRRLWIGQMVSLVGRQVTTVAVPFQVYMLTRSPLAVGAIGLAQAIPLITVSLASGAITDRVDRRSILVVTQLGLAATSALLALGARLGNPPLAAIYAVVAVSSGFAAVDAPTRTAIIPNLVPRARLTGALALNMAVFETTLVAGPAIGGLVIAHAGLTLAYLIDVATFAASLTAVIMLPRQRPHAEHHDPPLLAIRRGLQYIRKQPVILGGFAMDLSAMIFGMPRALFPVLAATTLHAGAQGLGLLYAAPGAGALVATLMTGWIGRASRLGRIIIATIVIWGLAIVGFGFATALWLALLLLVIAGAADSFSAVCRNTIMQTLVPDELRGRLTSVYFMVVVGGPYLGDLEAGAVASAWTAQISIVSGGVLSLIGLGAAAFAFPAVWAYGHRSKLAAT